MGCAQGGTVCCGLHRDIVQDCLELKWLVFDSTPQDVYHATEVVSASGTLQATSNTTGLTQITVEFSIGGTAVTRFTVASRQTIAFTVTGFDTITLTGNAASPDDSAAGTLCLTPRYELF